MPSLQLSNGIAFNLMSDKKNLQKARKVKNDEFYTQYDDIEKTMKHYADQFKGKTVLCNCDDYTVSNFHSYFLINFEKLGLKKLIVTCFKSKQTHLFSDKMPEPASHMVYTALESLAYHLKGDGDFRSRECVEILKEVDIVVTNPPFSLFRTFVKQLIKHEKKFLIIGNVNAITYKEIFKLLKDDKLHLGVITDNIKFKSPDDEALRMGNICWFTNLTNNTKNEKIVLTKSYTPEEYPKFDGYDAINVNQTKDIPNDYPGLIGVPVTFMCKYNPDQFEIMGQMASTKRDEYNHGYPYIKGKKKFNRIIIKHHISDKVEKPEHVRETRFN